ncbi:HAGHL isoform 6 [Pan troglodytes]|uniref:HAGHL isoform 6 n=2 Tax=Pan troglodytes TaxID=9598 RepID=A0A6D2XNH8_PANTR|nr:hydroxyacylglutathione hydrolase-like protein isoform X1 [Pan troglodytes]XP_016784586.1 hydroxyacylglutathione hydrolase-like protein isoform X1 [Pan troglodytes]XP_016784587.1 hydroxyacylglutathione hydrolase-like protein isoform X1 [Pan troglodytes]XP_034807485.1 hydroxyacylglutathione hydrolase-like protein isoform X1 [Pan paniscus]XP_034807486.1 hydroxyacylglutathione hydrolase-like protein isoform X1 [Pan paniscus]XP_034807487.1 hydroxyacylglutathione hydrolase-like protein isoform X1
MKVKVIPVLEDNYMYLVIEELTREAVAVDVAVPKRLLEIVGREGVSLTAVLTTHHHWDHARGNPELARLRPGLAVLGADERIFSLTRRLAHGEELRFGAIHVRCLLTPGHTAGHMSYFLWEDDCPDPPALFSGDALSVAGCGSCLEGSAQQMYQSLAELGTLPPETKVFCGHEHTLSNLEFAQKVEPCNDHVRAKLSWAKARPLSRRGKRVGGEGTGFGGGGPLRQGLMVTGACGHSRRGMRMTCPQCRRLWARSASTTPSCGWREYGCCPGASTVTWTLRKASGDCVLG